MTGETPTETGGLPGRPLLVVVCALLALTLALPLWSTHMEAPQYREDEALEVAVYAGRVSGDIGEIELLNEYIGVHLNLDTPELKASPWVLGGFVALALASVAASGPLRRRLVLVLCTVMLAVTIGGAALLQYRLYQMGHDRGDSIMARIPDFTPPILGTKKIANFTTTMSLGSGGWAYVAALVLAAWSVRPRNNAAGIDEAAPTVLEG